MQEQRTRPDASEIKNAYDHLFNSSLSLSKIKDAALGGRLFPGAADMSGVAGRSLAWKLFLIQNEPLHTSTVEVPSAPPLDALRSGRKDYARLLMEKMRAPDGSYEEGFIIPGLGTSPPRVDRPGEDLDRNNPLSLHDENPWTEWFAAVELRKTILQDVERTFPDIGYFRDADVQAQLTQILFLYSVMHPDIGYRQGMHELLASLYYAVDFDSIPSDADDIADTDIAECCSRDWVSADAWMLFTSVMQGVGRWYEWQEPKVSVVSPLTSHVQLAVPSGSVIIKPYVAPIVEACNCIQSTYLKSVDPDLWRRMQSAGIEPQIYGIRWLRLLFTREFDMHDAMLLWDGLFACDPTFDLAQWVCVAMLLRIRNKLIPSDYSGQITYLLRYPSLPPSSASSSSDTTVHPANLLLRQALTLQMSPNPATGVSIVYENRNLLDIPVEVSEPPPPPVRRRPRADRGQSVSSHDMGSRAEPGGSQAKTWHVRQQSSPMGLPEMLARGLLERGESLGINKTVMNAVSELKRNLPDLAASIGRLPMSPNSQYTAYPLTDERPPTERPPWEPRTRFEMERDISELRDTQRKLGDSVAWIVDTLLQDEGDPTDAEHVKTVQNRKREAVECLAYVRDVLKGSVTVIEEDRLVGEEEYKRRKMKEESSKDAEVNSKLSLPRPAPPPPAEIRPVAPAVRNASDLFSRQSQSRNVARSPPKAGPSLPPPPAIAATTAPAPPRKSSAAARRPSMGSNVEASAYAPWNYTRSSFAAGDTPLPFLPRVPPPTSTTLLRPPPSATGVASSAKSLTEKPTVHQDPIPTPRRVQHDPLGAIP